MPVYWHDLSIISHLQHLAQLVGNGLVSLVEYYRIVHVTSQRVEPQQLRQETKNKLGCKYISVGNDEKAMEHNVLL